VTYPRVIVRLVALSLANLAFYLFVEVSGACVQLYRRLRGDRSGARLWRTRVFHAWGRCMARLLSMRIEVEGRPPEPPFFLVSNHLSYTDVVLLASQLRCVFVSKAEVRDWPAIGRLCASVDTLFIKRESKRDIPRIVQQIERVMEGGRGVVVFPEGTSSGGDDVLPFRPPLLEPAARAELPVSFATITYRTPEGCPPAREVVCWWADMPFGPHVLKLLGLPGFDARVIFGKEPVTESDRKVLATRLRSEVERQLRPVISDGDSPHREDTGRSDDETSGSPSRSQRPLPRTGGGGDASPE
jgi:1-acyl-sn-glycerol-3-phosphate acyltransferase